MTDRTRTAPFYQIPPNHIVSVEHPAIIQNADKAVDTLQGNAGISRVPSLFPYTCLSSEANNPRY